jgi:hypothetical protein
LLLAARLTNQLGSISHGSTWIKKNNNKISSKQNIYDTSRHKCMYIYIIIRININTYIYINIYIYLYIPYLIKCSKIMTHPKPLPQGPWRRVTGTDAPGTIWGRRGTESPQKWQFPEGNIGKYREDDDKLDDEMAIFRIKQKKTDHPSILSISF